MMCFSTVAPPVFTGSNYTPRFSLNPQKQTVVVFDSDRSYCGPRHSACVDDVPELKNLGEQFSLWNHLLTETNLH